MTDAQRMAPALAWGGALVSLHPARLSLQGRGLPIGAPCRPYRMEMPAIMRVEKRSWDPRNMREMLWGRTRIESN